MTKAEKAVLVDMSANISALGSKIEFIADELTMECFLSLDSTSSSRQDFLRRHFIIVGILYDYATASVTKQRYLDEELTKIKVSA